MTSTIECPLCAGTAEDRSKLRVHLMVEHRKSDLAELIVEGVDADRDPIPA